MCLYFGALHLWFLLNHDATNINGALHLKNVCFILPIPNIIEPLNYERNCLPERKILS